jgi:hypothetical protein
VRVTDPFLLGLVTVVAALCMAALALSGGKGIFWMGFGATLVPLGFVDRYYVALPSNVKWMGELAVLGAGVAALALAPEARARIPRRVIAAYGAILALAIVSLAVNRSSWAALIVSQRGYVLFFATLVALKAVYEHYGKDRVLAILVGAIAVSGGVCVLQRITIAPGQADRVTGLFSFGEAMLFFHLFGLGIVVIYWLEGRRVLPCSNALLVGLLLLSMGVANQEAALPYLALVLGYLVLRARRHRLALLAGGAALAACMAALFTFLYDAEYSQPGERSFAQAIVDPAYLKRYVFGEGEDVLTPGGDLRRGAAVRVAYEQAAIDSAHLVLGRGPGATSESGIAGASGPLARAFPGIGRVTLSMTIGETGVAGLVLYVVFLLAIAGGVPGATDERREQRLARELFVLLSLAFVPYARLCYEASYAWALGTMLYPGLAPSRRLETARLVRSAPLG